MRRHDDDDVLLAQLIAEVRENIPLAHLPAAVHADKALSITDLVTAEDHKPRHGS